MAQSIFWHDYETFGLSAAKDRASQFAGIRTDMDLNIIDNPVIIYCKPADDALPSPDACIVTGITPQLAQKEGLSEPEFAKIINREMSKPETVIAGFNSIRFDTEFSRNICYRNFIDPYECEWKNGNSRFDIYTLAQATHALRPDGIVWPTNETGELSFKLTDLTKANGISHESAHDAMSDVYATIALAKLIKEKQPKLYKFFFDRRLKTEAEKLLVINEPVLHVSSTFGRENNYIAMLMPISDHPTNKNAVITWNLAYDPAPLFNQSAEELKENLFTGKLKGLVTVHKNKSPILAPLIIFRDVDKERLNMDTTLFFKHAEQIKQTINLWQKTAIIFGSEYDNKPTDPDLMIYAGNFFNANDKSMMTKIRAASSDGLKTLTINVNDSRIPEMLFRYKGRNFPESLSDDETAKWKEFCVSQLSGKMSAYYESLSSFTEEKDRVIIQALRDHADSLMAKFNIELDSNQRPAL